jgi:2-octaprenyl-6-methoxyphenol hydroxylase
VSDVSADCERFDVAIVGGGMVGASLALALRDTSLKVILIEAIEANSDAQPSFDDRATALGNGARRVLHTLGVWPQIALKAAPIRSIHISDAGHFGFARLQSSDHDLDAFGYTVSNRHIGAVLWDALRERDRVVLASPARVLEVNLPHGADSAVRLKIVDQAGAERRVQAALVVAADGAHSLVKQAAGIDSTDEAYQQTAVVANIKTDRPARDIAYERFAAPGPMALMPRSDGSYTIIWALDPERAEAVKDCTARQFCEQLQHAFGWRAGRICEVGQRHSYRLALVQAHESAGERVALIGNAAQALHPVAGQGFNLGLRDASVLAELIASAPDPGAPEVLARFAARRADDRRGMISFTDKLVKLFGDSRGSLIAGRNLGLLLFDVSLPAKRALARLSLGFGGALPRLARGLPLHAADDR